MTTRLAIIGGGYAGYALARALDEHVDVTLIEARDAFVHNVAAIRALTDSDLIKRIIIPYDKLLKNGRVVRGRAVGVDARGVALSDGISVSADIIVAATGSAYAAPFKPESDNTTGFAARLADLGRQFRDNDHVVIVGAGAVGVELAGETKAALPWKRVSLVSNVDRLFPTYPPNCTMRWSPSSQSSGSDCIWVTPPSIWRTSRVRPGRSQASKWRCTRRVRRPRHWGAGSRWSGAGVAEGDQARQWTACRRSRLRPSSLGKVFAIGDLADTGEGMTIVAIMGQVSWLTKAIRALSSGKTLEALPAYQPRRTPPYSSSRSGRNAGRACCRYRAMEQLVVIGSPRRSRAYFIPRLRKEFGQS